MSVLALTSAIVCLAFPSYRTRVPNGMHVACPPDEGGCLPGTVGGVEASVCNGLGHNDCAGGMTDPSLSPFGVDFIAHGYAWSPELCEKDSDGDGLTNGEELGDPCCEWSFGDSDSVYMKTFSASHPGRASEIQEDYIRPACGQDQMPGSKSIGLAGFNSNEEQRSVKWLIKNYTLPKVRTNYKDFLFNFDDDDHDIFHIVYAEAVVDLAANLHHFVVTGCSVRFPDEQTGVPVDDVPEECDIPIGGFAGWAPGAVMWENPLDAGTPLGHGIGIKAISVNVHYTDADLADHTLVAQDGIILYYTPTLRPKSILSTSVINVGVGPRDMRVPPDTSRFFLTRSCTVRDGCIDRDKFIINELGMGCAAAVASIPGVCDDKGFLSVCPKACGRCTTTLPLNVSSTYYHAHLLGREMYMTLDKQTSSNDRIDLNSQRIWYYDDQATFHGLDNLVLEDGDVIQTTCVFDSTDRTQATPFGLETVNEMCINNLNTVVESDAHIPFWGPFVCEGKVWVGRLAPNDDAKTVDKLYPVMDDTMYWEPTFDGNIRGTSPNTVEDNAGNAICPVGFTTSPTAVYFDPTTNDETACKDADAYCSANPALCGDQTDLYEFFLENTDCCMYQLHRNGEPSAICAVGASVSKTGSYTDQPSGNIVECTSANYHCATNYCGPSPDVVSYFSTTGCCVENRCDLFDASAVRWLSQCDGQAGCEDFFFEQLSDQCQACVMAGGGLSQCFDHDITAPVACTQEKAWRDANECAEDGCDPSEEEVDAMCAEWFESPDCFQESLFHMFDEYHSRCVPADMSNLDHTWADCGYSDMCWGQDDVCLKLPSSNETRATCEEAVCKETTGQDKHAWTVHCPDIHHFSRAAPAFCLSFAVLPNALAAWFLWL